MNPTDALEGLKASIDIRRITLLTQAESLRKGKRYATITCGVIALLSGTGMTAVLWPALDSTYLKIASALLAFFSGFLNILLVSIFDDKEIKRMDDGASQLLAAQFQIEYFLLSSDITQKQAQEFYGKISSKCVKIFGEIDSFISYKQHLVTRGDQSPRS